MIPPKPHLQAHAHVQDMTEYRRLHRWSLEDPEGFWREQSRRLSWFQEAPRVMDVNLKLADIAWFPGGRLNVTTNCVDRHAAATPDKTAIIWLGNEPKDQRNISFQELQREVCRLANTLKAQGVRRGDRVCLYMPMVPELAYAMLACARIGAVHSVVFAGFSAEALRDRILDAQAGVVLTANELLRGPKRIGLKAIVDEAIQGLELVRRVLVVKRTDTEVPMQPGRDLWLHEETRKHRGVCPAEWMDAEDPLFILYTSGSTGKPKGVLHTTGGYLTYAATTFTYVFDAHPDDVFFCAADAGWITGHSYILYGPLACGVTTTMFESLPTYPDAGRYWQAIDQIGATIFYTAPTALRALLRAGDEYVTRSSRASLRVLGSVGEPINPEVWRWYHDVVGGGRCAVVDTWWQTETGGVLISPLPGCTPCKPGSATLPFFGVDPVLLDEHGAEIPGDDVSGNLCLRTVNPGHARTLYGDHERFIQAYFSTYPGLYFTGDGCRRDEDGYYWITGRVDDVINVSGHRLGTAEIESALVAHGSVAEAAVVGFPHDLKGQGIYAYVYLRPGEEEDPTTLVGALKEQVRHSIGAIAMPDVIQIVPGLPKTRSGKIMRRILRKIAAVELDSLGDTSTLADPSVVEQIVADRLARR